MSFRNGSCLACPLLCLRRSRWRPEGIPAMLTDRFEADYLLETPIDPARAAEIMAGEQSSGTFVAIPGETPELKERASARVVALEILDQDVPVRSLPSNVANKPGERITRARVALSWPLADNRPVAAQSGRHRRRQSVRTQMRQRVAAARHPPAGGLSARPIPGRVSGVAGHAAPCWRGGPPPDRHDHQAQRRARSGRDRRARRRALRRRHRLHQGRRAAVRRAGLSLRPARRRG